MFRDFSLSLPQFMNPELCLVSFVQLWRGVRDWFWQVPGIQIVSIHYSSTFPEIFKFDSILLCVLGLRYKISSNHQFIQNFSVSKLPYGKNPNPCLFVPVFWKPMHTQILQNQSNANLNCCEGLWNYLYSEAHLAVSLSFVH